MKTLIRLYMASISAVAILHEEESAFANHHPAFILARTLSEANREARALAYKTYPESDGWSHHSAVISPVDLGFYQSIENLIARDLFSFDPDPLETPQSFIYDPNVSVQESIDARNN